MPGLLIGFLLGLRRFRCCLGFSFRLGRGRRSRTLVRNALFLLALHERARASSENWTVCRAVEIITFLSALLAREFSVIFRLASALEKISGAYLSACPRLRDFQRVAGLVHFQRNILEVERQRQAGFPFSGIDYAS